ncbi:aminotransferase class IV [Blastopirellula marina]|uniref:Probable branched-chain amino acid aminotransferase n=1 Tax=Blastopirellula marina DSM 3645 TaxID=314230 RepID=A3ZTS1_9BACT|nr:aminotransferase class IV [Blastopirellula marina]EAQ79975.1 probable branched-chain amino acid aminotransferase [Blastopirellula marina DSM 3645]
MTRPIAFHTGKWIPLSELSVPIDDLGFVMGTTIVEQLRTFAGKVFRLEQHLARLRDSLTILGLEIPYSDADLSQVVQEIVAHNHPLLAAGDDLGVAMFITPGSMDHPRESPMVCVHTRPVAFGGFASKFAAGQALVVPPTRQTPVECWPRQLKVRSRVHYYLADLEAQKIEAKSRAVLLDLEGYVMEATTANLVVHFAGEGLVAPPRELVLSGISIAALEDYARRLGIDYSQRRMTPDDVAQADEILLTSTSPCVLPCHRWNGRQVGGGKPGPVFERLISAWSESVGLDIRGQAARFAQRD